MAPDIRDLEASLYRLQKEAWWTRLIGLLIVALVVGAFFVGAEKPSGNRTLQAQRFEVVDQNGKQRAALGIIAPDTVGLVLIGDDGTIRARLDMRTAKFSHGSIEHAPRLEFLDANSKVRIKLEHSEATLVVTKTGEEESRLPRSLIEFFDADRPHARAEFGFGGFQHLHSPHITLRDSNGKVCWSVVREENRHKQ